MTALAEAGAPAIPRLHAVSPLDAPHTGQGGHAATPDLARLAARLAARNGDDYLADRTIRRIFAPLSALFATAVEEGFLTHNLARDVNLPSGRDRLRKFDADDQGDDDDPAPGHARALTREQLGAS